MSEHTADFMPGTPTGPGSVDAETAERMRVSHQSHLAGFNHLDPTSACFGRPDLAEQFKAKAEVDYQSLLRRAGIRHQPETEAQRQEREFDAVWEAPPVSDNFAQQMQIAVETEEQSGDADRHQRDLTIEFGTEGYAELIRQAKLSLDADKWTRGIETCRPVLLYLAARGRFLEGHQRARRAR